MASYNVRIHRKMEDSVTSSLNLFDIIVRLVPGSLAVMWWAVISSYDWSQRADLGDMVSLFVFFVTAYIIGTVLRGLAKPLTTLVHYLAYGGNPRDRYAEEAATDVAWYCPARAAVLDHDETRRLARACERQIVAEYFGKDVPKRGEHHYRFALGTMLNALEAMGNSGKEDRMLCLSDMCSSLAVVFFVGAIASWLCAMGVVWVCLAVALGCISLVQFLRYERFRYGTIVRTYAIRHKKVRRAMRKHSASDCDGHEALARDLNRLERLAASLAERARSS